VIPGETPVAKQLAERLRELGAAAVTGAIDAIAADEVRGADGLILLDGLADAPSALPPVLFPLIKASLTSDDATATGQHWILAAGEVGSAETAGLAGLFRAISLEYPERFARYVALDRVAPADEIAGRLLGELLAGTREPAVTYADDIRYQLELVPAEVSARASDARASDARASDGSASNGSASNGSASSGAGPEGTGSAEALAMGLTRDSVVVLIGGARGITARIGRELAAASGCRIELVGRTQAPGEPLSADVEAAPDAVALRAALARQGMRSPAEIGRASRDILARREIRATLTELRELGSQVRYHCADAQDEEAIHQILKLVHEEHGRIDGLVYGAGIIEDRLIADKDPESFARVFHTKVSGAQVLLGAVEELQCAPGFVVLFGSIAATFGSRGQSDYAAANDALEAIGTAWGARTGHRCLTVHWGPWAPAGAHPGMVTPELGREYAKRGMGMIDPRQGARSLLRELAWGDPGVTAVIYTGLVADAG
jgi:NAD(P)-dependent dehydrogenase (short-subunit alcohol dehydrogenase family)